MDSEVPVGQQSQRPWLTRLKKGFVVAAVVVASPWWFGVLSALVDLGRSEPEYKYYGEPPPEGFERDLERRGLRMNVVAGGTEGYPIFEYADAYNFTVGRLRDAP